MAFYLSKTASEPSADVDFATRIAYMEAGDPDFTGDWEVLLDCDVTGTSFIPFGQRGSGVRIAFFTNLTTLQLRRNAGNVSFTLNQSAAGRHTYKLVGSSANNNVELFQDDVSCGTVPIAELCQIGALMEFGNSSRIGDIYRLTLKNNGVVTNDYFKESLVGSNDTVFTDVVGGNDGTLLGFPSDNSNWVSYDAGGGGGPEEQLVTTSSILSLESFGTGSLDMGTVSLQPSTVSSGEVVSTPSLDEAGVILQPSGIVSSEFVDSPSVEAGLVFINSLSIASQEFVDAPSVENGRVFVGAPTISSQEILGQPSLANLLQEVIATSLSGQSLLGRPSVAGGDKIAIPVLQRYTYQAVREHLLSLGFEGQVNEVILKWLRSEGFEGQFNEAFYKYLENEGYAGDLSTKFFKWKQS